MPQLGQGRNMWRPGVAAPAQDQQLYGGLSPWFDESTGQAPPGSLGGLAGLVDALRKGGLGGGLGRDPGTLDDGINRGPYRGGALDPGGAIPMPKLPGGPYRGGGGGVDLGRGYAGNDPIFGPLLGGRRGPDPDPTGGRVIDDVSRRPMPPGGVDPDPTGGRVIDDVSRRPMPPGLPGRSSGGRPVASGGWSADASQAGSMGPAATADYTAKQAGGGDSQADLAAMRSQRSPGPMGGPPTLDRGFTGGGGGSFAGPSAASFGSPAPSSPVRSSLVGPAAQPFGSPLGGSIGGLQGLAGGFGGGRKRPGQAAEEYTG